MENMPEPHLLVQQTMSDRKEKSFNLCQKANIFGGYRVNPARYIKNEPPPESRPSTRQNFAQNIKPPEIRSL
jgi:hypothetical protein